MAAPPPGPDTLITIKVAYNGGARKLKFPLRDLTADVLEPKLRAELEIPAETNAIIERYSDSSAAYITLDAANTSVYKQLFRAAKAKQKLKLRVSRVMPETPALPPTPEAPQVTTTAPKPASVEAESTETESESNPTSSEYQETTEAIQSTESDAKPVAKTFEDLQAQRCDIITRVNKAMDRIEDLQARLPFARAASEASMPISTMSNSGTQDSTSTRSGYAVCCNSCDVNIPYEHYHCSICDDGDFDLCPGCYSQGVICHHPDHVLAKRFINNGSITTVAPAHMSDAKKLAQAKAAEERLGRAHAEYLAKLQVAEAQKAALRRTNEILAQAKAERSWRDPVSPAPYSYESVVPSIESCDSNSQVTLRTCNSCIQDLPEAEFVHCQTCDDFDLCKACFAKNRHGHHPKHAFAPIVPGTCTESEVKSRLAPGRNQLHHAICDGCEKDIRGVRHKCLQCPDWDYCSTCHESAKFIHAGHRFVPIYEPLEPTNICPIPRALTHVGVCCDGPHCNNNNSPGYNYIVGDRYKCAVCDDVDFCAKCEASPANAHNKTHPLIKFKTPVRNVNVTTTGEHENGRRMPAMGDRPRPCRRGHTSRDRTVQSSNVMTVVDVKPSEPASSVKTEVAETPAPPSYVATYVRDKVVDGTVFGPDHVFEQTWVVRNDGPTAWPAGCFVKYLHGEYMGLVDSNHPTATGDLESCLQSNVCQRPVAPGETVPFTVVLRSPSREGRHMSHWRVSTKEGLMIGHKLWCDIVVKKLEVAPEEKTKEVPVPVKVEDVEKDMSKLNISPDAAPIDHSQVVFPKLDKESPSASMHQEDAQSQAESRPEEEDYEECEDVEWDESESYMTDEEYDILDASDEESVTAPRK
ncbi:hypothetical protein B0T20DRAFT_362249 [Sordaria brevicollis]|uniref:ZZ-type domain-containing protein n=1 Tax=Sordaria brevicollis TaxID=83679 RepID=A0AAE0U6E0_SORBR|nr:hypothetical protein B0T20DRAFT_362249 [Sordaria brevicollis]